MKIKQSFVIGATLLAALASVQAQYSSPTTINGNGDTGFGGPVGNGNLVLSDDGANLTFTLNTASSLNGSGNDLVLYIDSVAGGFGSTAGFNDANDGGRSAVSGYSGSGQSVMTFTSGFLPDYALDIQSGYIGLFSLANGGNNSLGYITGALQSGSSPYSLTVSLTNLGLTPGAGQTIGLFGTLVSESGYRSTEAIAGNDTSVGQQQGWIPFTQTGFNTYATQAVPEPSSVAMFGLSGLAMVVAICRRRHV